MNTILDVFVSIKSRGFKTKLSDHDQDLKKGEVHSDLCKLKRVEVLNECLSNRSATSPQSDVNVTLETDRWLHLSVMHVGYLERVVFPRNEANLFVIEDN